MGQPGPGAAVIAVAIHVCGDRNDSDNQWGHVLNHFRPDAIYTFTGGRCKPHNKGIPVTKVSELPGPVVFVSRSGKTPLSKFKHPADCCYLFGPDHTNFEPDIEPDHTVRIDYPGDLDMFSWVAGAVVLSARGQPDHR